MKKRVKKILMLNLYLLTTIIAFFLFLFLLITEDVSKYSLLYVIVTIWLFDTFSYFGGKTIGGKKLMPKISSGKTVSGLLSGVLLTIIVTGLISFFYENIYKLPIIFTLVIIVLSFIGDTLVSVLKRHASTKDSGDIMPGHGGLLDRFDSFIMVFFIFGVFNLFL